MKSIGTAPGEPECDVLSRSRTYSFEFEKMMTHFHQATTQVIINGRVEITPVQNRF